MLSIGTMGHGQGAYYTGLAREDYYLEGGEPPGTWYGRGAAHLGLVGQVQGESLARLMEGFHPQTGQPLIQNAGQEDRRPGWDLTFSAPKSVSVLWSQAAAETRREIQEAHHRAVQAALTYLEDTAAVTRRGKGGREKEPAQLVVATFEHGTSRAQDPQLHTHALVLNVCTRADGTTGTVDSTPIYWAKMTAGALYRTELAFQLEARLGLVTERNGRAFEVVGVDRELIREFSKRRQEIEAVLDARGQSSAWASAVATLDTRQTKEHLPREQLLEHWLSTGQQFGWSRLQAEALLNRDVRHRPEVELPSALRLATERATEQQSWFTADQLLRYAAEESQCRGLPASRVRTGALEYLATNGEIVGLGCHKGEPVYTTREMLRLETELLGAVERSKGQRNAGVSSALVEKVVTARPNLSEEQSAALQHLVGEGGRIRVVSGMAGTGKTTLLTTARQTWELEGFKVYGAALQGKAARGLEIESGIRSDTLHRTLMDLERGWLQLDERSVVVLDEAGMVGTRLMRQLVEHTERAGARLVLVGDARQIQPIEAGGPFLEIQRQLGAAELKQIRRQREEWAREAVHQFARGEAGPALKAYAERGLLTVAEDRRGAMDALVEAWKVRGLRAPQEQLIFTGTREEAAILNAKVQAERVKAGVLGPETLAAPGSSVFHPGDRVLFTRKDRTLGVENGDTGEVLWVQPETGKMCVQLDRGTWLHVPVEEYPHVQLGYAMTTNKGQGATVERAFILAGGPLQDREVTYVQGSRSRGDTRIFVDRAEAGEQLTQLVKTMSQSRQKDLAHALQRRNEGRNDRWREPERSKSHTERRREPEPGQSRYPER